VFDADPTFGCFQLDCQYTGLACWSSRSVVLNLSWFMGPFQRLSTLVVSDEFTHSQWLRAPRFCETRATPSYDDSSLA